MRTFNFYMDDSGTRHPDHSNGTLDARDDWFALGGVIIDESDEDALRTSIATFKTKWGITGPLHSHPIRRSEGDFKWMRGQPEQARLFLKELTELLVQAPVIGHGCVIDRPAYNRRYTATYGRNRWSLCKTTFTIAVERAAKYAISQEARIKIFVEASSRQDEAKLKEYYLELQRSGAPFDNNRSAVYGPLDHGELRSALFEFKVKQKSSPIMQIADLYLYPICKGGYDRTYLPYQTLCKHNKLIDQRLCGEDTLKLGIKYSCFDGMNDQRQVA